MMQTKKLFIQLKAALCLIHLRSAKTSSNEICQKVNCDFTGNTCGWTSITESNFSLTWVKCWEYNWRGVYYQNFIKLNVGGRSGRDKGKLTSPWLNPQPGHSCQLTFQYNMESDNGCRLSLHQNIELTNDAHLLLDLWNVSTSSDFKRQHRTIPFFCDRGNRYQLFFAGERLDGRKNACGEEAAILIDDIECTTDQSYTVQLTTAQSNTQYSSTAQTIRASQGDDSSGVTTDKTNGHNDPASQGDDSSGVTTDKTNGHNDPASQGDDSSGVTTDKTNGHNDPGISKDALVIIVIALVLIIGITIGSASVGFICYRRRRLEDNMLVMSRLNPHRNVTLETNRHSSRISHRESILRDNTSSTFGRSEIHTSSDSSSSNSYDTARDPHTPRVSPGKTDGASELARTSGPLLEGRTWDIGEEGAYSRLGVDDHGYTLAPEPESMYTVLVTALD